jgi:hypothetical protein
LHDEDRWHDGWLIVALAGFLAANFVDQTLLFWAHHWCIVHPTLHGAIVMLALCAGMRTAIWLQKRGERL